MLQKWREREPGEVRYLYLDARYEKVGENGMVPDMAVLIATGIKLTGEREVLGVSTSLSEHADDLFFRKSFLIVVAPLLLYKTNISDGTVFGEKVKL